jgi:hypothetical protein
MARAGRSRRRKFGGEFQQIGEISALCGFTFLSHFGLTKVRSLAPSLTCSCPAARTSSGPIAERGEVMEAHGPIRLPDKSQPPDSIAFRAADRAAVGAMRAATSVAAIRRPMIR